MDRADHATRLSAPDSDDPFLWLEDRNGAEALAWVNAQNTLTIGQLRGDPTYLPTFEAALQLMTAEDNIAVGSAQNGHVYNFWQDRQNPLGIWRRTSVASYKTVAPDWQVILDFDALAAQEGVKWVFSGARRLYPDFSRCLLSMSPDGGDAAVLREFDIETRQFIEDGFRAPASKSNFSWLDRDTVLLAAALEESDQTDSGYPRVIKLWKRGAAMEDAEEVFSIAKSEVAAGCTVEYDGDRKHVILVRSMDFFTDQYFVRLLSGALKQLPLPDHVSDLFLFKGHAIFGVRSVWTAPRGQCVCLTRSTRSTSTGGWNRDCWSLSR